MDTPCPQYVALDWLDGYGYGIDRRVSEDMGEEKDSS